MFVKLSLILLFVSFAYASNNTCINQYLSCQRSTLSLATCKQQVIKCASTQCTCFDIASASNIHCNGTDTKMSSCLQPFEQAYRDCVSACHSSANKMSEIHKSSSLTLQPALFGISKCWICEKLAGFVEGKSCALVSIDFDAACDIFAPLCEIFFDEACDKIQQYLFAHAGASPQRVCQDLGFCSKSSKALVKGQSVLHLSDRGVSDLMDRQDSLPEEVQKETTLSCWASSSKGSTDLTNMFSCSEQFAVESTSTSHNDSSSSVSKPIIITVSVFAALIVVGVVVVLVRRRRLNNIKNYVSAVPLNNGYVELSN